VCIHRVVCPLELLGQAGALIGEVAHEEHVYCLALRFVVGSPEVCQVSKCARHSATHLTEDRNVAALQEMVHVEEPQRESEMVNGYDWSHLFEFDISEHVSVYCN